jgi:LmbE family N-acetylglucosaminyl deacetylase
VQPVPSEFTRFLVVGAHPDDAEFFAGGTLAALAGRGAQVHLAVCTSGGRGGRGIDDVVGVRAGEQTRAAQILGLADVINFRLTDGELEADEELRRLLVRQIRQIRPEVVLGHDPRTLWTPVGDRVELGHTDHRAAGQALLDAIYPRAANPNFFPELGLEPWCPRQVWLFDTPQPELVLDVTETWPTKLEALLAHASQERVAGGLSGPALELARQFRKGEQLGEGFLRLQIW